MSVVSTSALTRRFGGVAAVDSLDLDVTGGVVGLLGPNGSGKTTLLRMLATVLSPTSGDVSIFGLDPSKSSQRTDIRRRLGYLPQDPGFYRGFSAFDLVDYVAVLKEMSERSSRTDEVRRVLTAVDLADVMHKKIRALSGGQRQRVALAAALLGSPDLLVLDEPATGLDPAQRLQLRSLLSEHGRRGTVVLSTHHTVEVAAFCQRVIVMLHGRVHFDGTPSELAQLAAGRVWVDHDAEHRDPSGRGSPPTAPIRAIGDPPTGAELVEPTIDDGYLLIANGRSACDDLRPRRSIRRRIGLRRSRRALVAIEARRSLTAPWLWLGIALSTWFAYSTLGDRLRRRRLPRTDGVVRRGGERAVRARRERRRSRSHHRRSRGARRGSRCRRARARSAARALAGLRGRRAVRRLSCSLIQRVEGGMWIADRPAGGNEAVFSIVEMLQPPMLFVVAATAGVALGRASAHRSIVSVAGALVIAAIGRSSTGRGNGRRPCG